MSERALSDELDSCLREDDVTLGRLNDLLDERSFALAGEQVEPAIALLRRRCHGVTVAS